MYKRRSGNKSLTESENFTDTFKTVYNNIDQNNIFDSAKSIPNSSYFNSNYAQNDFNPLDEKKYSVRTLLKDNKIIYPLAKELHGQKTNTNNNQYKPYTHVSENNTPYIIPSTGNKFDKVINDATKTVEKAITSDAQVSQWFDSMLNNESISSDESRASTNGGETSSPIEKHTDIIDTIIMGAAGATNAAGTTGATGNINIIDAQNVNYSPTQRIISKCEKIHSNENNNIISKDIAMKTGKKIDNKIADKLQYNMYDNTVDMESNKLNTQETVNNTQPPMNTQAIGVQVSDITLDIDAIPTCEQLSKLAINASNSDIAAPPSKNETTESPANETMQDTYWPSLNVDDLNTSFETVGELEPGYKLKILNKQHLAIDRSVLSSFARFNSGDSRKKITDFLSHILAETVRNTNTILSNICDKKCVDENVSILTGMFYKLCIFIHKFDNIRSAYTWDSSAHASLGNIRDKFIAFHQNTFRQFLIK